MKFETLLGRRHFALAALTLACLVSACNENRPGTTTGGTTGDTTGGTTGDTTGGTTGDTTGGTTGGDVQPVPPDKNLLVAFVGDFGTGNNPMEVYRLIRQEGADFAIFLGDYDYKHNPKLWVREVERGLGADFPIFGVVGNHDTRKWSSYQAYFERRLDKIAGANCQGDLGVDSTCTYRGLHFILSGIGVTGSRSRHERSITAALDKDADTHLWNLCIWHANQRDFQAGDKRDQVGWRAFQQCQEAGAPVFMAHEHSYSRTRVMTDIGNARAGHGAVGEPDALEIGPGRTFTVVSGLGGKSIRDYEESLHDDDTWWATLYTGNYYRRNGEEVQKFKPRYGALFVRFNVDGDAKQAQGYFKNVRGEVIDTFEIAHQ
ncbi:hypothetical protein HNR42_002911 [Deinobacterium chartae]|uniref:Calcineurin-like phosphoesterase domain-containing protein n=1 Tax=Deinobacterium chartae TaxID=521158 RepID=A0A841I0Z2_9DEIO|nr:metallophosphoesterase [Deinobacterium chartae]MBB6099461.1 hypothetical protein [Deinobacterium chartae]